MRPVILLIALYTPKVRGVRLSGLEEREGFGRGYRVNMLGYDIIAVKSAMTSTS